MRKLFQLLPLLIFSWGLFWQTGWGQLLNTLYTHREIEFFEEEEGFEDYKDNQFQLIPNTEIYFSFIPGIGFISEKDNFTQIKNLVNNAKDTVNQGREATNQLEYFRENNVKPYQLGVNVDVFIFKYIGLGFTYSRNHYFSHLYSVSAPTTVTNYYNETVSYSLNAIGNNFQFSVMGRYPFGKRFDNNIFFVGGLGYTLSTLAMTLHFDDKVNSINRQQDYSSTSHAFHLFTELLFKVNHLNFGFGLLLQTIKFTNYTLPDNPEFTPQKYEGIRQGPMLYFKVGFNI